VYIDSCCFIDVAKGRHKVALEADRAVELQYIEGLILASHDGQVEVWSSTLAIAECLNIDPRQSRVPDEVQATFLKLLTSGSPVKTQAVDFFVAEKSRDLRWVHGIPCGRGADSIHVATALELECVEFLTTNKKKGPLQGKTPEQLAKFGLGVILPHQTAVLSPQYITPLDLGA
jgi:hypothetical protein